MPPRSPSGYGPRFVSARVEFTASFGIAAKMLPSPNEIDVIALTDQLLAVPTR
jgi:hypothetical protein